jgi:hypothetical protein
MKVAVLVAGHPGYGFDIWGPFDSIDDAGAFVDDTQHNMGATTIPDWWVVPMYDPNNDDPRDIRASAETRIAPIAEKLNAL